MPSTPTETIACRTCGEPTPPGRRGSGRALTGQCQRCYRRAYRTGWERERALAEREREAASER